MLHAADREEGAPSSRYRTGGLDGRTTKLVVFSLVVEFSFFPFLSFLENIFSASGHRASGASSFSPLLLIALTTGIACTSVCM